MLLIVRTATIAFAAGLISATLHAQVQSVPVTRSGSAYDPGTLFTAPLIHVQTKDGRDEKMTVSINGLKQNGTGAVTWHLTLSALYRSLRARRYEGVSLLGGQQLSGDRVRSTVLQCERYGFCEFSEIVVVPLPASVVRAGNESGLQFRWNAETPMDAFEVNVPAEYFQAVGSALR